MDFRNQLIRLETTAASVERFCDVVGNRSEKFKPSRNCDLEVPMNSGIVRALQAWASSNTSGWSAEDPYFARTLTLGVAWPSEVASNFVVNEQMKPR